MVITLIGSRNTPRDVLNVMEDYVKELNEFDVLFRSGGADGADSVVTKYAKNREIYLPWEGFNKCPEGIIPLFTEDHYDLVQELHPAPDKLTKGALNLHMRNINQVIGLDIERPDKSNLVLCWTKNGEPIGGTRTAIMYADKLGVPIINIGSTGIQFAYRMLDRIIEDLRKQINLGDNSDE
jgi:hypothetical protein